MPGLCVAALVVNPLLFNLGGDVVDVTSTGQGCFLGAKTDYMCSFHVIKSCAIITLQTANVLNGLRFQAWVGQAHRACYPTVHAENRKVEGRHVRRHGPMVVSTTVLS